MSPKIHVFLKADITKIGSAVDETRTPAADRLHKNTSPATSFLFDLNNENVCGNYHMDILVQNFVTKPYHLD